MTISTRRITPQIVCSIIQRCMSLEDDQIWIYNQRRAIPEDTRMYVVVGLVASKTYASTNNLDETTGLVDSLSQFVQETISIDVFSYTTEAVERYPDVIGSLKSSYSQQIQELNALRISQLPLTVNDVSHVEGPTMLNRISMVFTVLRRYNMLIEADYYDQLSPGYIHFTNK